MPTLNREILSVNKCMPVKTHTALVEFAKNLSLALNERDPYTRLHSDRVVGISSALADYIKLSSQEKCLLRTASALHDIGKIGIPDSVLFKPIKLDEMELSIMQTHADRGYRLVLSSGVDDVEVIADAIRHHHENYDGSGYPSNLSGENIPILSRMICIADNYDAMATRRVYQIAKKHTSIIDIMSGESGTKHDPQLFESFIKVIDNSSFRVS